MKNNFLIFLKIALYFFAVEALYTKNSWLFIKLTLNKLNGSVGYPSLCEIFCFLSD